LIRGSKVFIRRPTRASKAQRRVQRQSIRDKKVFVRRPTRASKAQRRVQRQSIRDKKVSRHARRSIRGSKACRQESP
jgi:hypothetical protein